MIAALLFLIDSLIQLAIFLVIVAAILSWLVAFDVINLRNPTISPIILLLLLQALRILVDRTLGPLAYGGTVGL